LEKPNNSFSLEGEGWDEGDIKVPLTLALSLRERGFSSAR
jgi:hypothetical protein